LSKWAGAAALAWGSFLLGMLGAWYYTVQLIGDVPFADVALSSLLYGVWLTVVITATLLMSALLRSGAAAAAVSLPFAIVLSVVTSSLPRIMKWSPARLTTHAYSFVRDGHAAGNLILPLAAACLVIILLLAATVAVLRRKEQVSG